MKERKVLSWGLNIEKDNTMVLLLVLYLVHSTKIPFFVIQTWTKWVILKLTAPGFLWCLWRWLTGCANVGRATFGGGPAIAGLRAERKHTASNWLPPAEQLPAALQNFRHWGSGLAPAKSLAPCRRSQWESRQPHAGCSRYSKGVGSTFACEICRSADGHRKTLFSLTVEEYHLPMNVHPKWHCCLLTCGNFLLVYHTKCYQGDYWKTQLFLF